MKNTTERVRSSTESRALNNLGCDRDFVLGLLEYTGHVVTLGFYFAQYAVTKEHNLQRRFTL
jgi:hypothetical protein